MMASECEPRRLKQVVLTRSVSAIFSWRPLAAPSRLIEDGGATLHLVAWGAFTVGAEVLDDQEKQLATLELDLSTLPDVPSDFRERRAITKD